MVNAVPHHIIAIGASAGGMEEINSFFDHTPFDGVAYVIIQHLSADFKSRMVELLAKHSKLIVKEAADEMVSTLNTGDQQLLSVYQLFRSRLKKVIINYSWLLFRAIVRQFMKKKKM